MAKEKEADYSQLDDDIERELLEEVLEEKGGVEACLAVGDVYSILREEFNNDILTKFEEDYPDLAFAGHEDDEEEDEDEGEDDGEDEAEPLI